MTSAQTSSLPSVIATDSENLPRHRWYFFKEAFSPDVVRHAAADAGLESGDVVYDPFSGSGTTALTATMTGFEGLGAEVNPFLRFVAQTKMLRSRPESFSNEVDAVLSRARHGSESWLEDFSTFSKSAQKAKLQGKWLFNTSVLRSFQSAWDASGDISGSNRSLTRLCLIAGAMDVANAQKDGKCLRYKRDWKNLKFDKHDFAQAVRSRAKLVAEDLEITNEVSFKAKIKLGDSRRIKIDRSFDLCVTSPPYLNSFDYTDVYRPELFLGGFVSDMKQLQRLRHATLRSHVQTSWKKPVRTEFGKVYEEAVAKLNDKIELLSKADVKLWDRRLPTMVQAYFEDMHTILKELKRKAKPKASLWLVVSTSAYVGVELPVDLILAEIGARAGWLLRDVHVIRHLKRVAGQQWEELSGQSGSGAPYLRESLVVFDAKPQKKSSC